MNRSSWLSFAHYARVAAWQYVNLFDFIYIAGYDHTVGNDSRPVSSVSPNNSSRNTGCVPPRARSDLMPDVNRKDQTPFHHLRTLTQKEVRAIVPYTPQHILRLEKAGKFPRRIKLGENRVGWRLIDIENWLHARLPAQTYFADPQTEDAL